MLAPIRKQQRVLILFLLAADLMTIPVALIATWYLRTALLGSVLPLFVHTLETYLQTIPALCVLLVASWWSAGMYSFSIQQTPFYGLTKRMRALFNLAVSIMAASYLVKMDYSRLILLFFLLTAVPVNLLFRFIMKRIASKIAPCKQSPATLIIGSGEFARRVIASLERLPEPRHRIRGVLTELASNTETIAGIDVIGCANDLPRLAESLSIDEVFFASGSMTRTEMLRLVNSVEKEDIVYMLVTDLFEIATGIGDLNSLSRIPVVEIGTSERGGFYAFLKRAIDILVSGTLLIILLPVMVLIWIVLLFTGKGSPVFRQTRIGRHGVPFTLYKFRTMKPEADEYEVAPIEKNDPRITPAGRFLRKTSFDELPQLFNVIRGNMSMVGPRPEMDFIVKGYNTWQKRRLEVKPGITGLWQIMGRKDLPLHENLEYDFYYMRNQSIMLDMAILARTVVTVLKGRGAY